MMKPFNILTITLLLTATTIFAPFSLHAEDLIDQSSNVFKFQQKLANNGNVGAQFKLATMYETGEGVTANIEQAKHWYAKATAAGSKPAMQRNNYLITKEKGYDQATDADWLNSVKTDAKAHKGEAMLLLGQLYREGLGVKKDLIKSLELLEQVQILGVANVEEQIVLIQNEIDRQSKTEQKNQAPGSAKLHPASKELQVIDQAEVKRRAHNEKVKRYEKAMQQLQNEQKKIDEQQAWASGGDTSGVGDDEI
jgi:uncharacterized small protein (DUF1192 family)